MHVHVDNMPAPDPLGFWTFIFTLIAAVAGVAAAVAAVASAILAKRTYELMTAVPELELAENPQAFGGPAFTQSTSGTDIAIRIAVRNTGATTDGVYVDLFLDRPYGPGDFLQPVRGDNQQWVRVESRMLPDGDGVRDKYTRYFAQHFPGRGTVVDLDTFAVHTKALAGELTLHYRLRSADGSHFPRQGPGSLTAQIVNP